MRPWTAGHSERYSPFTEVEDDRDWLDCALAPDIHDGGLPRCGVAADFVGLPADAVFYMSTNGDFIAQDHEIGLNGNTAVFADNTSPDRGVRPGPNLQREHNWEYTASIQHEIAPRVSATFAYYHRVFGDIESRENVALQTCDPLTAVAWVPCGMVLGWPSSQMRRDSMKSMSDRTRT